MAVIPGLIGLAAVPEGLLRQRFEIRTLAIRTTISLTIAGLIAVWLGYSGYGGWALTAFAIVNALLSSVLVITLAHWTPGGGPRRDDARKILPILVTISGRGLATNAMMPVLQLMVGAGLGPAAAGSFQISQRFLTLALMVAVTPLRFASLPVFVRVRDDAARLRRTVINAAGLASLISAPIFFGLLAVAPILLPLAVGEANGTASVPTLQALLLVGGHAGLFPVFIQSLVTVGRASTALRWSLAMFVLNMIIGAVSVLYSETLVALGYSLLGYAVMPFMLRLLHIYTGIAPRKMLWPVFGPVVSAVIMSVAILLTGRMLSGHMSNFLLLAVEIALGAVIYGGLSLLTSRSQIMTVRSLLATLLPQKL
jgi:PST family polysaccharide transporter/lipopolysaccharide exporter